MHTTSKIAAAVAAATALVSSVVYAGGIPTASPSVVASANAVVVTPVTINQSVGLTFGTFSVNPTLGGTIDSSGNTGGAGGVSKVTAGTPATFTTSGVPNYNYTVVGDPTVTLTDTPGDTMTATLTYPTGQHTLNGSGADSFVVAGLLTVNPGQPANPYSGTYNVSVHY